jgi:WD40 repeat protein
MRCTSRVVRRSSADLLLRAGALLALSAACGGEQKLPGGRYEWVYRLRRDEGVFAYARISPNGRFLAYASEARDRSGEMQQTIRVVDLSSKAIAFTEPGIDAYWSNDGNRMIYLSKRDDTARVSIRDQRTGRVVRNIAPARLGDYFSWGVRDGRDLILTIEGNYYFLDGTKADLPARAVPPCPGIGRASRPLLSKDGRQITTFLNGTVVVRNLTDCDRILDTGIEGAKADFSWDGRYIAFHAPKPDFNGYEIEVVDLENRTIRTVTDLPGSSLFPSWTADGRICFRYDGDEYRGFVVLDSVLSAPERPLPSSNARQLTGTTWSELFPDVPRPKHRLNVVVIWATWSAHAPLALRSLAEADGYFRRRAADVGVAAAVEISTLPADAQRLLADYDIALPQIHVPPRRLSATGALNQIPTTLLFRDSVLIDRRLGAVAAPDLTRWVANAARNEALLGSDAALDSDDSLRVRGRRTAPSPPAGATP